MFLFLTKTEFQSNNSRYSLFTKRSHFYWPTLRLSLPGPCNGEAFQLLNWPWVCHCAVQNCCLHTWRSADAGLVFSIRPRTELVPTHWKKAPQLKAVLVQLVFGTDVECGEGKKKKKKESRVAHWPPNSPCMFYINQLEFFFFPLFVFHDEFQTQDEKNTSTGLFFGSRCVFSNIMKACVWVSPPISLGGLIRRIPTERVLPMAWKERDETSWGQNLARARWGPGEDSRNEKPCLKRLAMPQTQHFEGRPKALRVENTILNKFPFPFCAPDIIKTPWISNSHPQKLHRLGKGSLSLITTQHLRAY